MGDLQRTPRFLKARLKKAKKKLVPKKVLIEVSRRDDIDKENLEKVMTHATHPHFTCPTLVIRTKRSGYQKIVLLKFRRM